MQSHTGEQENAVDIGVVATLRDGMISPHQTRLLGGIPGRRVVDNGHAGIRWLRLLRSNQELADLGSGPVGTNQEVAFLLTTVFECRNDTGPVRDDGGQPFLKLDP